MEKTLGSGEEEPQGQVEIEEAGGEDLGLKGRKQGQVCQPVRKSGRI